MEIRSALEWDGQLATADPAHIMCDLAHELRQSLGSAETIACYLNMVLDPADERARRQVGKIRHLVEQMACQLQAAVHLAQLGPAKAQLVDLHELAVEELAEHVCGSPWNCELRTASEPALAYFDPEQLRHLIRSLALYCRRLAGEDQPIRFETEVAAQDVTMRLAVSGPTFDECPNPEPSDTGSLVLRSAGQILRACGGRMSIERHPGGGVGVEVVIPAAGWTNPALEATKAASASLE